MNLEELQKKSNFKTKRNSQQDRIVDEVHRLMNPDNFEGLLRSKLSKVIDKNSLEYLFQKVIDKVQYSTVTLEVFADGSVVYSENGVDGFKDLYFKNPNDTSKYNGVVSAQTMGMYKTFLQCCLEAERVLAPKGFVPKEYSIGLLVTKTLWNNIDYSIQYRKGIVRGRR